MVGSLDIKKLEHNVRDYFDNVTDEQFDKDFKEVEQMSSSKGYSNVNLVSWEDMKAKLSEKDPWYKEIYYFFRYRLWTFILYKKIEFIGFFQRGKRGYAKYDLWSFDCYLCKVIGSGVKELAGKSIGWPDEEFKTQEEYTAMLNKMADGFLNYYDKEFELDGSDSIQEYQKNLDRLEESLELFKKYFGSLWD